MLRKYNILCGSIVKVNVADSAELVDQSSVVWQLCQYNLPDRCHAFRAAAVAAGPCADDDRDRIVD
jgi:hypothetical protein